MTHVELEEALDELLPPGYSIEVNKRGQIIILTNLMADDDGELIPMSDDEVDPDMDPDFDPLEDEDVDDD